MTAEIVKEPTKFNIKSWFKLNRAILLRILFGIIIFTVIFLNSGYTYTYLISDTFLQTIVLIISFLCVGTIYLLTNDFSIVTNRIKSKKPSWLLISLVVFGLGAFVTIFATGETANMMMYMSYGIRILCAIVIAKLLSFERFVKYYQIIIFALTIVAIFVFLFTAISGINFSILPEFVSGKDRVYFNYFFLAFQYGENRIQSIFWEPGLFATFLLLAMAFEILFRRKTRPLFFAVYLIGLFLTFSTFGYVCFAIVCLLAVNKKVKNFWLACLAYALVISIFVLFIGFTDSILPFLTKILPSVFTKLDNKGTIEIIGGDRLYSPMFDIECWLKSPIFGNGMSKMTTYYADAALTKNIHAQTSTTTYFLAEFGILGLAFPVFFSFGLFKMKNISPENKAILFILFLLILSKEPHQGIMLDYILMFLFVKEGLDNDYKALAFDEFYDNSLIMSFSKKDNSSIVKRNVLASFSIKGLALILGFFSYPIYMRYFNNNNALGVWLTILSLMSMIITFDLGLGNGLRNKLVKPLLDNDYDEQNKLITSTYVGTLAISLVAFFAISIIILLVDLNALMGVDQAIVSAETLKVSMILVCGSICLEFVLKNVTSMLQALQKQAFANTFALISTIMLMVFALVTKFGTNDANLLAISIAYIFTINIPLFIGTVLIFKKYFKQYKFKKADITKTALKSVATLGLGFFIIQLMLLAINSTNEIIISNFYGSDTTVVYSDYYKLIQIVISLFATITLPYWSMVTKLKEQNDISGIYKMLKRLLLFICGFVFLLLLIGVFFQPILDVWLSGKTIKVDYLTLIFFMLYALFWIISTAFASVLNGLSIIYRQVIVYGVAAIVKFTGVVTFGVVLKNSFGWEYIVMSNAIACFVLALGSSILCILELRKIKKVNENA